MHYAQEGQFHIKRLFKAAGRQIHKAVDAPGYAIGVDTHGTLLCGDRAVSVLSLLSWSVLKVQQ